MTQLNVEALDAQSPDPCLPMVRLPYILMVLQGSCL